MDLLWGSGVGSLVRLGKGRVCESIMGRRRVYCGEGGESVSPFG